MASGKPGQHGPYDEVLLSDDLLPQLHGWFDLEHHAVKGVCQAWRGVWAATLEGRGRVLRPGPVLAPPLDTFSFYGATPDGERLVLRHGGKLHFLNGQMDSIALVPVWNGVYSATHVAFGQDFIITTTGVQDHDIHRYSYTGDILARHQHENDGVNFDHPILSPTGLLFCVGYGAEDEKDGTQDEIYSFDSSTLQLQRRFGRGLLDYAQGLAVCDGELFVCDCKHDCIQVFSFSGELLRAIRGEWRRPGRLLCARSRLYLTEDATKADEDGDELFSPEIGRRIFMLSTSGAALQTQALELEPAERRLDSVMAVFGENLVLQADNKIIALTGL